MSSDQPWTIESIRDALGAPSLAQRFLAEINKAPAHELLTVFAKWERIAKNMDTAFADADDITASDTRGDEPPTQWEDITDQVLADARRIRSRGAA